MRWDTKILVFVFIAVAAVLLSASLNAVGFLTSGCDNCTSQFTDIDPYRARDSLCSQYIKYDNRCRYPDKGSAGMGQKLDRLMEICANLTVKGCNNSTSVTCLINCCIDCPAY